jgi:lysine 6-dehydrogenase
MRYMVLGAGQQGRAIAFDLLRDENAEVVLADSDPDVLEDVYSWLDDARVDLEPIDAESRDEVRAALDDIDVAINALPYRFNLAVTEDAIVTQTHLVDLGGNNDVVEAQFQFDAAAREAGVLVVPDCGLAPGLANYLAADACERLSRIDQLRIRVGGLPQRPQGELEYMLTFNVEGLLNEYSEPCLVMRDRDTLHVEPLTEIERVTFPDPWGELEAFHTSGGLSTLPRTLGHRVDNMDYKTLRYPGHAEKIRGLYDQGLFSREPRQTSKGAVVPRELLAQMIEHDCTYPEADVVLVRVYAVGSKHNVPLMARLQIIDRFDKENGITAMMRMTGYPTAILAQLIARGAVEARGVQPGERVIPMDVFRTELKARDIHIEEVVKVLEA